MAIKQEDLKSKVENYEKDLEQVREEGKKIIEDRNEFVVEQNKKLSALQGQEIALLSKIEELKTLLGEDPQEEVKEEPKK